MQKTLPAGCAGHLASFSRKVGYHHVHIVGLEEKREFHIKQN